MKDFFKNVLANVTAMALVFGGLGAFLMLVFIAFIAVVGQEGEVPVRANSVLVFDLSATIADAPPQDSWEAIVSEAFQGPGVPRYYLLELLDAIEQAAEDDRIGAILLRGSLISQNYGSGLGVLREVRDALIRFKETGKPVIAYLESPSQRDYYLASAANEIILHPYGELPLPGLASESIFFGNALNQYGIGVQTTKVGRYKGATEIFTHNAMSPENREQLTEVLGQLWSFMVADMATARGLSLETFFDLSREYGFFSATRAKELKLVDRTLYFDQLLEDLQERFGKAHWGETFVQVNLRSYINQIGLNHYRGSWRGDSYISVIYAEGDIVDGEGGSGYVGGDWLARQIRQERLDPQVAAIVLRVNSPGGSAVASEVVQREIREAVKDTWVIVSMGSLAASGGYWISAYGDWIFAEPATITGSIGVFGLIFNFQDIAGRHGISFDGVKTGPYADLYTLSRPKTEREMKLIQERTDFLYDAFLDKVAEGRSLDRAKVESLAQGRIWTGWQAVESGLVDELGGLTRAIQYASEVAELGSGWTLRQIPEKRDKAEALQDLLRHHELEPLVARSTLANHPVSNRILRELAWLRSFNSPQSVYARLPFLIEP